MSGAAARTSCSTSSPSDARAGCHIALDDRFVSQLHAWMFRRDDQCFIEDLGSTNGTFLNDDKVTSPALLTKGDHVRIGNVVMELQ